LTKGFDIYFSVLSFQLGFSTDSVISFWHFCREIVDNVWYQLWKEGGGGEAGGFPMWITWKSCYYH